jgi:hypothetical protein
LRLVAPAGLGQRQLHVRRPRRDHRKQRVATTFTSGKQIITGRLVARLTNVSTGKSVVVQISGPGIEDLSNPSVFNLNGTSLLFPPGQLLLTRGPVSLTFDQNGNVTSLTMTSASAVDLCRVLGDL